MIATEVTRLPGVFRIRSHFATDPRGSFLKTFHRDDFGDAGLQTSFPESYVTRSTGGVIRGMHFQLPPHHHTKVVWAIDGRVVDVVVDLRRGSPDYGRHVLLELDAERGDGVYIPPGFAHGFCVPGGDATLLYLVGSQHAPDYDTGVRYDSLGVTWPVANPIVSERDRALPALAAFESPFSFSGSGD